MPKGVLKDQLANSGTANNLSSGFSNNANSLYGLAAPELEAESAHPGGYTPTQLAAQNTAAQQSAGGSQAATVGQAGLLAARTGNAGAGGAAIAQSQRTAGGLLSKASTGIATDNADLQQRQQQSGLKGMESLYGTNAGNSIHALDASNQALNGAGNSSQDNFNDWWKVGQQVGKTLGTAGFGG